MTPEKENRPYNDGSWAWAFLILIYLFWPLIILIIGGALCPLFFFITGDIEYLILFLPFGFLGLFFWGYHKALKDTAEIARQRQQPPPNLSKEENQKKAESLYKFP